MLAVSATVVGAISEQRLWSELAVATLLRSSPAAALDTDPIVSANVKSETRIAVAHCSS